MSSVYRVLHLRFILSESIRNLKILALELIGFTLLTAETAFTLFRVHSEHLIISSLVDRLDEQRIIIGDGNILTWTSKT